MVKNRFDGVRWSFGHASPDHLPGVSAPPRCVPSVIAPAFNVIIQNDGYGFGESSRFVYDGPVGHVYPVHRATVASRYIDDGDRRIGRRGPKLIEVDS